MIRNSTSSWSKRLKRNKCRWPNPQESTGVYYRKMGRDSSCWEALNPARQTFIQIADEIKVHLEKHSDPVPQPVTWTMYMIGRTRETAEPTIMFCSKEEGCRKKVRKTVEESGILDRYPGVRVGDCSRPPDFDRLVQLAGEASVTLEWLYRRATNILASDQGKEEKSRLGGILREPSDVVCGSRIFLSTVENAASFRKATAGGILRSGDRFFYLTVAHAFVPTIGPSTASITEDSGSDFEFDIGEDLDEDLDEDQEDGDFVETTSRGSITPDLLEYASSDDTETSVDALPSLAPHLDVTSGRESCEEASSREGDTVNSSKNADTAPLDYPGPSSENVGQVFLESPHLDYSLIEISNLGLRTFNRIPLNRSLLQENLYPERIVNSLPLNTNVFAVTGSAGLLKGTLSGTPSFIMRQGSTRQDELWTVRLDGRLADGDCGSWVVEADGGDLIGHIVSGCPESGVAYIVPTYLVLEDVKIRCDLELKLSTAGDGWADFTATAGNNEHDGVRAKGTPCGNRENQGYTKNMRDVMDKGLAKMEDKVPAAFLESPPLTGSPPKSATSSANSSSRHAVSSDPGPSHFGIPTSAPSCSTESSPRTLHSDSTVPSFSSTPASSFSLDANCEDGDVEDQVVFSLYDDEGYCGQVGDLEPPASPRAGDSYTVFPTSNSISTTVSRPESPDSIEHPQDDTAVRTQPSRHVDYLSHNWKEADIWSSWRHIVSKRKAYTNSARLENASWRTWTKSKNKLKTISPETLNWLKDCDVTWLYGPLQTGPDISLRMPSTSPNSSRISKSNSFLNKKPILKRRSMSEIMLQRSLSSSSLLRQAAAAVQAQQSENGILTRPGIGRATSDYVHYPFSSTRMSRENTMLPSISSFGIASPGTGEKKHIHFNELVEQCIALDMKGDDEEEPEAYSIRDEYDSNSDDGGIIMKRSNSKRKLPPLHGKRTTLKASFSAERKTIAMLPSTTLKYREDTPEPQETAMMHWNVVWNDSRLSPSPSQETLRSSKPSTRILPGPNKDDDDADMD